MVCYDVIRISLLFRPTDFLKYSRIFRHNIIKSFVRPTFVAYMFRIACLVYGAMSKQDYR